MFLLGTTHTIDTAFALCTCSCTLHLTEVIGINGDCCDNSTCILYYTCTVDSDQNPCCDLSVVYVLLHLTWSVDWNQQYLLWPVSYACTMCTNYVFD